MDYIFDLVRNSELIATEGMAFQSYVALLLILVSSDAFHFNRQLRLSRVNYQKCASNDDVFGAEFITEKTKLISADSNEVVEASLPLSPSAENRAAVMKGYDNLRITFILDSIFISCIGLGLVMYFGTFKDSVSYTLGSLLGLSYVILLGRYVENLNSVGNGKTASSGAGGARFAPVILLVLLYGKNKETLSIIPELLGFFSYQIGSFLQIFNENAYGDSKEE